jgi:hypothetical protein
VAKLSKRHLFRADNTEGYDEADLDQLNERLEEVWDREQGDSDLDPDGRDKSLLDHLAEQVLAKFDAENADRFGA